MIARPSIALALLIATALSGCTTSDTPTLRILDQGSFPSFEALKPVFENQTGSKLILIDGVDAGNALRVALESAGNPPADILYGVDNALFFSRDVVEKGLFEPYASPNLARLDTEVVTTAPFMVGGQVWATPVDHGFISVNYDVLLRERYNESDLPQTLRDLASPAWASQFVTEDPRASSPGLGFLLATIDTFGEAGEYTWKDYWNELLANGGLVVQDWSTAYVYHFSAGYGQYDETNAGDRTIVVSYTTSPAAEVFFSGGSVTQPPSVSLEPDRGVFHQVETMGILRGTKNLELAQKWIDFILTDELQGRVLGDNAVYPVVRGPETPEAYAAFATAPPHLVPAKLTSAQIGANLDRWLAEWRELYQAANA